MTSCQGPPQDPEKTTPPTIVNPYKTDTASARASIDSLLRTALQFQTEKKMDSCLAAVKTALQIAEANYPHTDTTVTQRWFQRGSVERKCGYIPSSLHSFKTGLALVNARGPATREDSMESGMFYNSIAAQYSRLMLLDSAEFFARKAVDYRGALSGMRSRSLSMALGVLAIIHQGQGAYPQADSLLRLKLAIEKYIGNGAYIATALQSLGDLHLEMMDSASAANHFKMGLDYSDSLDSTQAFTIAKLHEGLARASQSTQSQKQTSKRFAIAKGMLTKAVPPQPLRELAMIELSEAGFYQSANLPAQALQTFHNALLHFATFYKDTTLTAFPEPYQLGREPGIFLALCGKAHVWEQLADRDGLLGRSNAPNPNRALAFNAYRLAFIFADKLRREFGSLDEKIHLAKWTHPEYERALAMAMKAYQHSHDARYLDWCFELMERSKANELLDALDQVDATHTYSLPDSIVGEGRRLALALDEARNALADGLAPKGQLEALEKEWGDLQEWVKLHYPAKGLQGARHHPWHELRPKLAGEDTLLLEYFRGDQQLYVLAGSGKSDTAFVVPWDSSMESATKRFLLGCSRRTLNGADLRQYLTEPGYFLFQKLVEPALALPALSGSLPDRMIVVPDGKLAFIPFEALLTAPPDTVSSKKRLPYLMKSTVVSYIHSLQLLHRLKEQPVRQRSKGFLGMGSARRMSPDYDPLPSSPEEARIPVDRMGGELVEDLAATEKALKELGPEFPNLHLTGHGHADPLTPLLSYILFHADSAAGEDGKLMAYEVHGLKLDAQLAVLSACETAKGVSMKGLGVLSLGGAFLDAGCNNVIMTLQEVDPTFTELIMTSFYDHLAEGVDAAKALQLAKQDFVKQRDDDEALPFFWAPFILQGPGDFEAGSTQTCSPWLWVLLAVLGLGWMWRAWRR